VYPDPKPGGKFSRKLKFFAKSFAQTETFRKNNPGNEISQNVSEFSLIFAVCENEKRGFRFNPTYNFLKISQIFSRYFVRINKETHIHYVLKT
jgi:hypothetical protein